MKKPVLNAVVDQNGIRFNLICDADTMSWMTNQIARQQNAFRTDESVGKAYKVLGKLTINFDGAFIRNTNLDQSMIEIDLIADEIRAEIEVV